MTSSTSRVVEVDKARGRVGLRIVGLEDVGEPIPGDGLDAGEEDAVIEAGQSRPPRRRRRRLTEED